MAAERVTDVLASFDRRLKKEYPDGGYWQEAFLAGRRVRFWFSTEEQMKYGMAPLLKAAGAAGAAAEEPASEFLYWVDDISRYLPVADASAYAAGKQGVFQYQDETGSIRATAGYSLEACDRVRGRYYYCTPQSEGERLVGHIMVPAFANWAMDHQMYMIHAALVGSGGKGVLLCGAGGRGKSTLAISCLLAGMDYVSDDYTLLSAEGPLTGRPLYSMVGICKDMRGALLRDDMPILSEDDAGKRQVDISRYPILPELGVHALIMPEKSGLAEPEVVPDPGSGAITQLVISTLRQGLDQRNTGFVRALSARLGGLPSYRIRLSRDLAKNTAVLEKFIQENL